MSPVDHAATIRKWLTFECCSAEYDGHVQCDRERTAALASLDALVAERDEARIHAAANHDEYLEECEESGRLRKRAEIAEYDLAAAKQTIKWQAEKVAREMSSWTTSKTLAALVEAAEARLDTAEKALHRIESHLVDYSEGRTIALVALGLIGRDVFAALAGSGETGGERQADQGGDPGGSPVVKGAGGS